MHCVCFGHVFPHCDSSWINQPQCWFQLRSFKLKKISLPFKRADRELQVIYTICRFSTIILKLPLITQHVLGSHSCRLVISVRTRAGRQPLKMDLRRIDYLPFRGLLQAAGAEIKAVKAWVGSSVLTMRLQQRPKVNSPVWEVYYYLCAALPVISSFNQSQLTGNTTVSCFWPSSCWRSWCHVGVMSQQGEWREEVLAIASEWLCQQV